MSLKFRNKLVKLWRPNHNVDATVNMCVVLEYFNEPTSDILNPRVRVLVIVIDKGLLKQIIDIPRPLLFFLRLRVSFGSLGTNTP